MLLFRSKFMSGAAMFARTVCFAEGGPPPADGAAPPADDAASAADGAAPPADGAAPPADGAAPPADGAAPPAGADAKDWRDKEIDRKHRQLQAEKRRAQDLESELETTRALLARQAPAPQPAADGAAPPAATDRRPALAPSATHDEIQAAARQIVTQEQFNASANNADAEGKKKYGKDWDAATDRLATLGGFEPDTMTSILATHNPAQVLYKLGSKPEEYQRIMDLPPAKRQTELVKLGLDEPKPSNRPDPDAALPVDSIQQRPRASGDELRDELPDEDWYARRARQKAARFALKKAGKLSA